MAMQKILVDVEMLDGTEHTDVRVILADMLRYSDTAQRHKWPNMQTDMLRAGAFMAFAAMQRTGLFPVESGFDAFTNQVAMVAADFDGVVDPTTAATPAA